MNQDSRVVPVCGLALSGVLAMGCFVEVRDETPRPSPRTGSLTVGWTINGRSDPRACARFGRDVADFELLVYRGDRQLAERYAPCEDFRLTLDLREGTYTGLATLVDDNRDAVTSSLPLPALRIVRDASLNVDVDFPSGSFL